MEILLKYGEHALAVLGAISILLHALEAGCAAAGWTKYQGIFSTIYKFIQGFLGNLKPPSVAVIVMFLMLSGSAFAQTATTPTSTTGIDISTIISKLTLHEAVGYDIKSGNVTYYTSADLLDWKSLSLSGGYSTSSAIVGSLDWDIGGLSKLGITSPLLSILDLRLGMFVGISDISTASSSGSAERNKLCWGPEVTLVSVKF